MRRAALCAAALTLVCLLMPGPLLQAGRAAPASAAGPARGAAAAVATHPKAPVVRIPLRVSLEWNTRGTFALAQWKVAVQRAAQFLRSATNGQATIDLVALTDDAKGWANADVRVYAHNTGVPDATIGGLSPATIAKIGGVAGVQQLSPMSSTSSGGVFSPGAIHLGRSWSEYGPRRGRWSDPDGFSTIVHELGHYAFFLYDEYYGYDNAPGSPNPRPSAYCTSQQYGVNPLPTPSPDDASLMYWEYSTRKFWNLWPGATPPAQCAQTRQWQVYGASDWQIMAQHYPALTRPAAPVSPTPLPTTPCLPCIIPGPARWLLGLDAAKFTADGYLMKEHGERALHEGVPYVAVPPGVDPLKTSDPLNLGAFYPANRLEIMGGGEGDVVRVTLTAPDGSTLQAVQPLDDPFGRATLHPQVPAWYAPPRPAVPFVDAMPLLAGNPPQTLVGLLITATNPLPTPMVVGRDVIAATLFEAGRGPGDHPRHPWTYLYLAGAGSSGGGAYAGKLNLTSPPILDGALYLTPRARRHEDPAWPGKGAWALASFSVSCNSPTGYSVGHAPGDEGGLDSADGVVNVHVTTSDPTMHNLCIGFTGQGAAIRSIGRALSRAYAVHGSQPLPRGGTTVTLHVDLPPVTNGGFAAIARSPLPGATRGGKGPSCLLTTASTDPAAGTVAALVPASVDADGVYQAILVSPSGPSPLPPCSQIGTAGAAQTSVKAAQK